LFATCSAFADVRYVDAQSQDPRPPYTTWSTAVRVAQEAVDVALLGHEILVTPREWLPRDLLAAEANYGKKVHEDDEPQT